MKGLQYILHKYNVIQNDLAEELGITRVNIANWIKGIRPIPYKHLMTLKNKFEIPSSYFNRELTNVDITMIDSFKAEYDFRHYGIPKTKDYNLELEKAKTSQLFNELISKNDNLEVFTSILNIILSGKISLNALKQILEAVKIAYNVTDISSNDNISFLSSQIEKFKENRAEHLRNLKDKIEASGFSLSDFNLEVE